MLKKLTIKDLAVKHDYYCSDNNYYDSSISLFFFNFDEFYAEFSEIDIDMNLIFRWDVNKSPNIPDKYNLELFMIQQRKGIFKPIFIEDFKDENVELFIEFITPHMKKIKSIWKPLKF